MQDDTITEEEKTRRRLNAIIFWAEEGKKFNKLVQKIKKEKCASVENYFRYLGYCFKFKLLCEGKELSCENALTFVDEEENLKFFMSQLNELIKERNNSR